MGKVRNVCKMLVGKPEGKRPFERPRHVWRIILKCILIKSEDVEWICLAQVNGWLLAIVNTVLHHESS
jgi:hypothetical protein